jgi:hypothetical protein
MMVHLPRPVTTSGLRVYSYRAVLGAIKERKCARSPDSILGFFEIAAALSQVHPDHFKPESAYREIIGLRRSSSYFKAEVHFARR